MKAKRFKGTFEAKFCSDGSVRIKLTVLNSSGATEGSGSGETADEAFGAALQDVALQKLHDPALEPSEPEVIWDGSSKS